MSGTLTRYLLDTQPALAQVIKASDGTNTNRYLHGPRGIHAAHNGTDWRYTMQDGIGSVRGWVNHAGFVSGIVNYTSYGVPDAVVDEFGFTGEQTNENGLVYLRARHYNPNIAIMTALDPYEGTPARPMSLNGYLYVEGNVPNMVDPSGEEAATAAAIAVLLILGAIGVSSLAARNQGSIDLGSINIPFPGTGSNRRPNAPSRQLPQNPAPAVPRGNRSRGNPGGDPLPPPFPPGFDPTGQIPWDELVDHCIESIEDILSAFTDSSAGVGSQSSAQDDTRDDDDCPFPTHPDIYVTKSVDGGAAGLAKDIRTKYPAINVCSNRRFISKTSGAILGEVDVELDHILIEYKSGSTAQTNADLQGQMANYMDTQVNFEAKQIVYLAPNIRLHAVGGTQKQDDLLRSLGVIPIGKKWFGPGGVHAGGMTRQEFIDNLPTINVP